MTQDENVLAEWEIMRSQVLEALAIITEAVQAVLDAIIEFYSVFVETFVPPLRRAVKLVYLFCQRMQIYRCLFPFVGSGMAWQIAYRLPDWVVLRLPQRWVLLL